MVVSSGFYCYLCPDSVVGNELGYKGEKKVNVRDHKVHVETEQNTVLTVPTQLSVPASGKANAIKRALELCALVFG